MRLVTIVLLPPAMIEDQKLIKGPNGGEACQSQR